MSIKTDQAVAKMAAECQGKDYLIPFEEYLTSICTTDAVAEKILDVRKTLQGAFDKMKDIASKRKTGNFAYIGPEEGFDIIREYFRITETDLTHKTAPAGVIDITDLL